MEWITTRGAVTLVRNMDGGSMDCTGCYAMVVMVEVEVAVAIGSGRVVVIS